MTRHGRSTGRLWAQLGAALVAALISSTLPALALSEIKREDVTPSEGAEAPPGEIERQELPPPPGIEEREPVEEPAVPPATEPNLSSPDPAIAPEGAEEPEADEPEAAETDDIPVPEIRYDLDLLPEPVRRMRALIMEACLSGDIERLRPLLSGGENATQLSFGTMPADPIEFLRNLSGDDQGHEILAILYEVLAAGYVQLDEGEPGEMYVWPYFFAVPLDSLDGRQRVELFKIVTAGDYEDMKNFGAYIFYRVGISPEGRWVFFVAGD